MFNTRDKPRLKDMLELYLIRFHIRLKARPRVVVSVVF